jgi:hypothetical protein
MYDTVDEASKRDMGEGKHGLGGAGEYVKNGCTSVTNLTIIR